MCRLCVGYCNLCVGFAGDVWAVVTYMRATIASMGDTAGAMGDFAGTGWAVHALCCLFKPLRGLPQTPCGMLQPLCGMLQSLRGLRRYQDRELRRRIKRGSKGGKLRQGNKTGSQNRETR